MSGLLLCFLAFVSCVLLGFANWRFSLVCMMGWGYFFGILKAHYVASWGHFIFDSATIGFYASFLVHWPSSRERAKWEKIVPWTTALLAWPVFMTLIPLQHYLVQIVGLRGNIFWIPMLLVGCMLDTSGRSLLSYTLAVLNLVAFLFAVAEYFLGVEVFVPENDVTKIVYMSNDIAGGQLRIPSIFANAHSYAGGMVASMPWILGEIFRRQKITGGKLAGSLILFSGLIVALLGVFMAGPRQPVVVLGLTILLVVITGRVNLYLVFAVIMVGAVAGFIVAQDERFQRFTELQDIDKVTERVAGSVNLTTLEVILDYPLGNGMGSGGTSLPFFVQQYLTQAVIMENEYARVILEQGLPGFFIFAGFAVWVATRRINRADPDYSCKALLWAYVVTLFVTAPIGIGLMSMVPVTAMLFLGAGYLVAPSLGQTASQSIDRGASNFRAKGLPAYQRGLARI